MKLSFLFWNIGRKDLRNHIAKLVHHCDLDVLILGECLLAPQDIVKAINEKNSGKVPFRYPQSDSKNIHVFVRGKELDLEDAYNDCVEHRLTIRRLRTNQTQEILIAVVHFYDQRNYSLEAQQSLAWHNLHEPIYRMEDEAKHQRTVLVGDLNMNPYDPGMIVTGALNAVMTKRQARSAGRDMHGKKYRFFYNPMWGLLGDRTPGPAGTFYRSGDYDTAYWYMLDQVLLRPDMMDQLRDVVILPCAGDERLLTSQERISKSAASDHLPLFFVLDLE